MANTYTSFSISTGNQLTEYVIPFPFLKNEHINVVSVRSTGTIINWTQISETTFNASLVLNANTNLLESSLSFGNYCIVFENGQNKIKFSKPSIQGAVFSVTIYRRTFQSRTIQFSNGSPLQADDLNNLMFTSLYSNEEAIEAVDSLQPTLLTGLLLNKYDKTGGQITGNISATGTISSASTITAQSFNLNGGTLTNVPNPTNASDGANKAYVDSVGGGGNGGNGGAVTITDDSITSAFLRKVVGQEAVTTATIRTGAVTSDKIGSSQVVTDSIGNLSVNSDKIADLAITTQKIGDSQVTNSKLADSSVTTAKIADGSVTQQKLANNSFSGSIIANNTLALTKLLNSPFTFPVPDALSIPTTTLTINSPISSSKTAVFGDTRVGNLAEYAKLNSLNSVNLATDSLEERVFTYKENAIAPFSSNVGHAFTSADLATLDGQPLLFKSLGTQTRRAGYLDYNIVVPSATSNINSNIGATTIVRLLRQGGGSKIGDPSQTLADSKAIINFRTASNILFNSIEHNSGNPNIYLNDTTGVITIDNRGSLTKQNKYLCTLTGKAYVNDSLAYLFLLPPTTTNPVGGSLGTAQTISFHLGHNQSFYCTSIIVVGANNLVQTSVRYWLTKTNGNTAPTSASFATVNQAEAMIIASPYYNDFYVGFANNQDQYLIRDPRVELIIQKIQ